MSDDPSLSEAEKMRLKRLARLGGPSPAPVINDAGPSAELAAPAASSSGSRLLALNPAGPSHTPSPSGTPSPKPVSPQPASTTPQKRQPVAQPQPARASPAVATRKPSSSSSQNPPKPKVAATPQPPAVPYPDWETSQVSKIFGVTLEKSEAEASNWSLCWLKDLADEIREENPTPRLATTLDLRDRLLIARLSLDPATMANSEDADTLQILLGLPEGETIFEYLTGCWKRLNAANRLISHSSYSSEEKGKWHEAFEEMKRLIISYCGMTLEDPSMFPQPAGKAVGPAEFLPLLLGVTASADVAGDPYTSSSAAPSKQGSSGLKPDDLVPFLNDLVAGFPEGSFAAVITPTLSLFFQEWFKISPTPTIIGTEWRQYLGAVSLLVQVKPIAALFPSLPVWVAPGVAAPKIEWQSLLGPLTRLSVFPREFAEIWKTYFSNPTDRRTADIDANKTNLRSALGALQTSLFNIYNAIVRASPESREGVLDLFTLISSANEKRAGMRVDPRTVSSDGFLVNIHYVLLKLFEPVMDVQFSKIDKVDTDYYRHSKRLNIAEETKMRATKEEADEFFGSTMDSDAKPNFISDIFFLLNSISHLGLVKTIGTRIKAERNISDIEKELKNLEARQPEWAGNPTHEAQGAAAIQKAKDDIATLHASIHAYDTQLLDPTFNRLNVTFNGFVMNWLVRLVDPKHQHPQVPIKLPLPLEAPVQFKMLPEYLVENIVEYLSFLSHYDADIMDAADQDIAITFAITFLSPTYVNNPFLKAKLVSILANGLQPQGYHRRGFMFDRLGVHSVATQYLMPTLIRFFIDVEMTGGHTQFWDKFNFRRDISHIIKSLWSNPLYREAFVQSSRDDYEQFIKFVNMLMSDTTFHLEESLTSLADIRTYRQQKEDPEAWEALDQAQRDDVDSKLRQAESVAPFHTAMGRQNLEWIRDITATTKEPFLAGEIVDRLAASLDENLATLVGPKMQELKISDPERFSFKPKQLLAAIAQVYLNLGQEAEFIRSVANDGRSYSKELFERFARVLKNRAIMTDGEIAGIMAFIQRVEDTKATISIEDEREIPDEFLDPLLATLMKDPVILPMSRVTIDRSTIRAALLSKELDPFNNMPLKYEDLIPDTELKAKIDAWAAEGSNKPAESVMDVDDL